MTFFSGASLGSKAPSASESRFFRARYEWLRRNKGRRTVRPSLPEPRFLLGVAALFLVGTYFLMRAIHLVHAVPPEQHRRDWLKYGVYFAVINGLWVSAFLGRGVAATV